MYSPRIKDAQIEKLYLLAKKFNLPMTKLVHAAIEEYLKKHAELLENGVLPPNTKQGSVKE